MNIQPSMVEGKGKVTLIMQKQTGGSSAETIREVLGYTPYELYNTTAGAVTPDKEKDPSGSGTLYEISNIRTDLYNAMSSIYNLTDNDTLLARRISYEFDLEDDEE